MPDSLPKISDTLPDFPQDLPTQSFPANNQLRIAKHISIQLLSYPSASLAVRGKLTSFEFLWPIDGAINYQHNQTATPAHLALLLPGPHYILSTENRPARVLTIQFQIDRYPRSWRTPSHWPRLRPLPDSDIARPLLCFLHTHAPSRNPLVLRPALSLLVTTFITGQLIFKIPIAPAFPPPLIRALDLIRRFLNEKPYYQITPTQIAASVGICRHTLDKYFKRHLFHTPMQEINLARLDRALHLLARTNYPTGVVAAMTGFSQGSLLSLHCRAAFNRNPSSLRQYLQSNNHPWPSPRSPHLSDPAFSQRLPTTTIPLESLPYPPDRAARKFKKRQRRKKLLARLKNFLPPLPPAEGRGEGPLSIRPHPSQN